MKIAITGSLVLLSLVVIWGWEKVLKAVETEGLIIVFANRFFPLAQPKLIE